MHEFSLINDLMQKIDTNNLPASNKALLIH